MKRTNCCLLDIDCPQVSSAKEFGGKAAMIHKMRIPFKRTFPGGIAVSIKANEISDGELAEELGLATEKYAPDTLFAVRSSATIEDGVSCAFPGQFISLLNVSESGLLRAIREVQASAASDNVLDYCRQNKIESAQIQMGVLIMPMVGTKATVISGAIFTLDPESGRADTYISASAGFGDAEMQGIVTPEIAVCRGSVILRHKPRASEKTYLLSNDIILRLSDYAAGVEKEMRKLSPEIKYVDIEYVIEDGEIYFVQARPETAASSGKGTFKTVKADNNFRAAVRNVGYCASRGTVSGTAFYCETVEDAYNLKGGDILLCRETASSWEPYMRRCRGIVTMFGGANCHTAVCAREMGMCCITGIGDEAMEKMKKYQGKYITVDATARIIYEGNIGKEYLVYQSGSAQYGGLDSDTEEDSFQNASSVGQTRTDKNGVRWLKKPRDITSPLLHEIHRKGNAFITDLLNLPKVRDEVAGGIYWMSFADAFSFRIKLRTYTPQGLNGILDKWDARMREYLLLSQDIRPGEEQNLKIWLKYFVEVNAYMNLSYPLFYVISGLFEQALAERELPEPYFSRAHHCVAPGTPVSVAQKAVTDYIELLKMASGGGEANDAMLDERLNGKLGGKLREYALKYRFTPNNCIEFDAKAQIDELKAKIKADLGHIPEFFPPEEEEYFVNDPSFVLLGKIMRQVVRLKESSHHIKLHGQRLIIEKFSKREVERAFKAQI
ncbi:MAG: hypothetical protein LBS21_05990 [Clostridiales bacterium]|jgi:pyruvate,water dikinase|nr:hypothetical protein [Clostridiales bacterium]